MWMFLFLLFPIAGLTYASWHVWQLLPFAPVWRWVVVAVMLVAFFSMFLGFSRTIDRLPMPIATAVYEVGNSAIFVLLYVVMTFLVLDLLRLVHVIPRAWLFSNGTTSLTLGITLLVIFVYGNIHYYDKVRQPLTLTTTKSLGTRDSIKIVMMSDLHLGYHNPRTELARWVDLVNAEKPDLILIGGDIIDMSVRPLVEEDMAAEFRRLLAPVYACLGNHEYYSGEPEAQRFYATAGITLLRDSVAKVGDLCIIGRDDRTNLRRLSLEALMKHADRAKFTILLDHQPYNLEQAERAGIDFQFSGHTHHGQVWPISWITEAIYEKAFGEHRRGQTRYYVSSGIGIWGGKFRIGTRSEYVVATLTADRHPA